LVVRGINRAPGWRTLHFPLPGADQSCLNEMETLSVPM
jgi:hypothetical protein